MREIHTSNKETSSHTKIGYLLCVLAAIILLVIGLRHINDTLVYDRNFGWICTIEGLFSLIGVYLIDILNGKSIHPYPKKFQPFNLKTLTRMGIIFICVGVVQILLQVSLKVTTGEVAISVVFAAPAEEVIFRGFLITLFIKVASLVKKRTTSKLIEIMGIFFSASLFMAIHINYYSDSQLLLIVFASGLILGFFYWYWRDLTACILAHFLLNSILSFQTFWMGGF